MDNAGATLVNLSFGAFGARRGSNWTGTPTSGEYSQIGNGTRHGYTGHEHLDNLGIIHMNGRVYDPVLGRFLSADQIVRDVGASQAWNGYGYVEGRPLTWTDPSGWASDDDMVPIRPILPNEPPPPTLEEVPVTAGRIFPDFNFGPQILNFNTVRGLVQNPVQFGEGASGEGQSDGDKKDPQEEPKAEEPKPVCKKTGTPSINNNPNVNTYVATGAVIGVVVGVAVAIVIVSSFPKAPPITPFVLAVAGEPLATYVIVSLASGALGANLGGATGYAITPPMPPAPCP